MSKMRLAVFPLFLVLGCGSLLASNITLGSIATNNIAVFGFDSTFPTSSSVFVNNSSSTIDVTGNVVSPIVTNASGLTFTPGSGTATPTMTEENDLASVVTQLNALTYTSLTLTSGTTMNLGTPGDYLINTGVLGANTVINLTGNGQYVFKTTGNLTFTNVTINGNSSLSSDEVFWWSTAQVSVTNSSVFGDLVQSGAGNDQLQAAASGGTLTGTLNGRFLSEAATTSLVAAQSATLHINDFQGATAGPEPATLAFVFAGLAGLAVFRRRR